MFRRLDRKSGAVRWGTKVPHKAPQYFFHGDVFVARDRIIASADVAPSSGDEAGVHAFDMNSGRELWKHPAGRGVLGAVVGDTRGRVWAYSAAGELIALNVQTGKLQWRFAMKAPSWESPATVGSRVIAGSADGTAYGLDATTGRSEWQQSLNSPISTSIRATDGAAYAGTADGVLHRLSPTTGAALSSLKLDETLRPASAPVVTPDAVLVLLADQQANHRALVAVDPGLTRIKWRRAAPDRWSTTRIFVMDQTVYLGTPAGEVIGFCAADGSPAWNQQLAKTSIRSIGGSDHTLYVGTPQGSLFAVKPTAMCT